MGKRGIWILSACLIPWLVSCAGREPPPVTPDDEPSDRPADVRDRPRKNKSRNLIRIEFQTPAGVEVGGESLTLGMRASELEDAIGRPEWKQDYPDDGTAMAGTTYYFYAKLGMAVRTKDRVVEGFYVYMEGAEIDDRSLRHAEVELPRGISRDATPREIERELGEPTKRDEFESMKWLDLMYVRGKAVYSFHFNKGVFDTVRVEYARIKGM